MPTAHSPTSRVRKTSSVPTALMPSYDVGQISLSANGENYSFLMSRADFERLARRMLALLRETPPPIRRRIDEAKARE
jgi:hypothetical protein